MGVIEDSTHVTIRAFRVPGVGVVRVEIGDEISRDVEVGRYVHGHTYPAHRVTVDGAVVLEGSDWGVPATQCGDDVDAMLGLVFWAAHDTDNEELGLWVSDRRELRDALSAPWAGDWRDVVAEFRADRGW